MRLIPALLLLSAATPAARAQAPVVCEATWHDARRDRDVPVRLRLPAGTARVPVILFSHGLGGSLDAGTTWAERWVRDGFAVVHLQHAGSDAALLRTPGGPQSRLAAVRGAMTAEQLVARAGDASFVLDELARRPRERAMEGACDLRRLDLSRVGMSGHSFGAQTTQALAGQRFPGGRTLREPRIVAAVAFSPAPPEAPPAAVRAAFAGIAIPFLSVTGTRDEVAIRPGVTAADRTVPHASMPPGDKVLLVLDGATHMDFGGTARGGGAPPHVRAVVEDVTTTFWRATLLGDAAARARLADGTLRAALRGADRLETR